MKRRGYIPPARPKQGFVSEDQIAALRRRHAAAVNGTSRELCAWCANVIVGKPGGELIDGRFLCGGCAAPDPG